MHATRNLPPRALPRHFRQPRLLLVGCGDIAERITRLLGAQNSRYRIRAVLRHAPESAAWRHWRQLGATPLRADLDQPRTLQRLHGIADSIIYLAPPAEQHPDRAMDPRLNRLLAALHGEKSLPRPGVKRFVLISTTGVYGDQQGALIDETCPVAPQTARGRRRATAEATLRHWRRSSCRNSNQNSRQSGLANMAPTGGILRVPGIYAANRLPIERLRAGTPALRPEDDTWTNHIHADDLARICWLALTRSATLRPVNTSDDSTLKMGDWFDAVADAAGLARPKRLPRAELKERVSPMLYSFMSESRRLDNRRLKRELCIRLRYPTVSDFFASPEGPLC